jgi:phytoene dehydrogenase-like protein
MKKIAEKNGVTLHFNTPIKKVITKDKVAQ